MIICDAEYVHLWRFAGDGADTAFPAHEMRVKSQDARCIALSGAHHHDAAQAAWGCADGRVNFYDATTQTHALYIPMQPLRIATGGKGSSSPISAMCFVFSRLVLCGDESGMLFLVEFGPNGPQVVQSIEVHNKRYILLSYYESRDYSSRSKFQNLPFLIDITTLRLYANASLRDVGVCHISTFSCAFVPLKLLFFVFFFCFFVFFVFCLLILLDFYKLYVSCKFYLFIFYMITRMDSWKQWTVVVSD
jgi:hypothetical protein